MTQMEMDGSLLHFQDSIKAEVIFFFFLALHLHLLVTVAAAGSCQVFWFLLSCRPSAGFDCPSSIGMMEITGP